MSLNTHKMGLIFHEYMDFIMYRYRYVKYEYFISNHDPNMYISFHLIICHVDLGLDFVFFLLRFYTSYLILFILYHVLKTFSILT